VNLIYLAYRPTIHVDKDTVITSDNTERTLYVLKEER